MAANQLPASAFRHGHYAERNSADAEIKSRDLPRVKAKFLYVDLLAADKRGEECDNVAVF